MKIIATVDFSAQLKAGDSYELPESDARMLIAAGLATSGQDAEPVAATPAPRSRTYSRRDRVASDTKDLQSAGV